MTTAKSAVELAKEAVYFEVQEGQLCLQHMLNNGLQSNLYDAVTLADIGHQLDELERQQLDVNGQPNGRSGRMGAGNFDDTGFFNVQVLEAALAVHALELVRLTTAILANAAQLPETENFIICNRDEHWFCFRKLGQQWFHMDSTNKEPEEVTNTYLGILIASYFDNEVSVFLVRGNLPISDSQVRWSELPMSVDGKYVHKLEKKVGHRLGGWESGSAPKVVLPKPEDYCGEGYRLGNSVTNSAPAPACSREEAATANRVRQEETRKMRLAWLEYKQAGGNK